MNVDGQPTRARLSRRQQRGLIVTLVSGAAALYVLLLRAGHPERLSDLQQLLVGARAWLGGSNPYEAVRNWTLWPFPLLYPLPAVLLVTPLAFLPDWAADAVFVGSGAALLAWGVTRNQNLSPMTLAFVSAPFLHAVDLSQWSPLLTGAALSPWAGFLLVCKPNIGLALFAAFPNRATAVGAALLLGASLILSPEWLGEWRTALAGAPNAVPLVTLPGGPLLLLALLKWRVPEGRLIAVLGCVPHTTLAYEVLPLFLVAKTWREGWMVWAGTAAALVGHSLAGPYESQLAWVRAGGLWLLYCAYLPCLVVVLRRGRPEALR